MEAIIKIICFTLGSFVLVIRPISINYFSNGVLLGQYVYFLAYGKIILFLIGMSNDSFLLSKALNINSNKKNANLKKKELIDGLERLNSVAGSWLLICYFLCILYFYSKLQILGIFILSGCLISGNFSLALYRLKNNETYHYFFLIRAILLTFMTLISVKVFGSIDFLIFFETICNTILFIFAANTLYFKINIIGRYNNFSIRYFTNSIISNVDKIVIGLISQEILSIYALNFIFVNGGILSNGIVSNYIYSKKYNISKKLLISCVFLIILFSIFSIFLFLFLNFKLPIYFINSPFESFALCLISSILCFTCVEYAGLKLNKPSLNLQNNLVFVSLVIVLMFSINNYSQLNIILILLLGSVAKFLHFVGIVLINKR